MRQLRYVDFDCPSCGDTCTRFVYFDTDTSIPLEREECQNIIHDDDDNGPEWCGWMLVPREMSGVGYMKTITKGNADFSDRERERLEKRSDEHWRKKGRDEGIDRERALFKKHGAVGGVR